MTSEDVQFTASLEMLEYSIFNRKEKEQPKTEIPLCRKGQQLLFLTFPVVTVTLKMNITHNLFYQRLRASFMQIHLKSLTFILIKAHGL